MESEAADLGSDLLRLSFSAYSKAVGVKLLAYFPMGSSSTAVLLLLMVPGTHCSGYLVAVNSP